MKAPRGAIAGAALTILLYGLTAKRYLSLAEEHPETAQGFYALLVASTLVVIAALTVIARYLVRS